MKFYIFLELILIGLFNGNIYSQDSLNIPKSNAEIFSGLISKNLEVLGDRLVVLGKEKVYFLKFEKKFTGEDFFAQEVKKKLYNFKIITSVNINSDYNISIDSLFVKTLYVRNSESYFTNQKIKRILSTGYNFKIIKSNADTVAFTGSSKERYTDRINIDDVELVEKNGNDFMKSALPGQSFVNKIFIPAIVIVASISTIVLFYFIRSK